MASKGGFFKKFIAMILILIIIGGAGFLGYNFLTGGSMVGISKGGMNISSGDSSNGTNSDNSMEGMDEGSSHEGMDMSGSVSDKEMDGQSDDSSQYSKPVITAILKNKEELEKTLTDIEVSIETMTLDPFDENSTNPTTEPVQGSIAETDQTQDAKADEQGNTIVNVYPQAGANMMGNMGATYDQAKMEKLHTGIYNATVGLQLLAQLKDNLSVQLEQATIKVTNPSNYYNNQYLMTIQNKTKLNEALVYIKEAGSLVNINPYVSSNGVAYNKEKMEEVHGSINKFASAVINLSKLNDTFSNQTIDLTIMAQDSQSMPNMDMDMDTSGNSLFGNAGMGTIFSMLVIIFIATFVISIFGYMFKLIKSPKNMNQ